MASFRSSGPKPTTCQLRPTTPPELFSAPRPVRATKIAAVRSSGVPPPKLPAANAIPGPWHGARSTMPDYPGVTALPGGKSRITKDFFRTHPKRREYPSRASLLGVLRSRRKFAMSRPAVACPKPSCCVKRRLLAKLPHPRALVLSSIPPKAPPTPRRRA